MRMLWPTGVLQDEIRSRRQQASRTSWRSTAAAVPARRCSSGMASAMNSSATCLARASSDTGSVPDERNIPRPAEYIKIERDAVRQKDGKLSFRLMEPMEEAVYLDQVRLLAVDHPADVDVFPNEYFASNPPYPPFKVLSAAMRNRPAGAWDEHGHDLLPDLLAHRYFGDFEMTPFQGFAKPHTP